MDRLRKAHSQTLVSVILYGSAAGGDHHGQYSDVNVLCVLTEVSPAGLGASSQPSAQTQSAALAFSRCMRAHGVPSFPDPSSSGLGFQFRVTGVNPDSPQFRSAQQRCGSLLPGGAP